MAALAKRSWWSKLFIAVFAAVLGFCSPAVFPENSGLVVLYPDLPDYNAVFEAIADGVAKKNPGPIYRISLPANYTVSDLKQRLANQPVKGVVALGRRGLEAAQQVEWTGPVVVSAILWDPSLSAHQIPGISLDPDPRRVLGSLRMLAPDIRRVFTIVNYEQNKWLLDRARSAVAELGLTLTIKDAATLRTAAQAYRDVLQNIDPTHDALWLPLDPNFDESTLRLILGTAWKKRLVVFSSGPDMAQRGALFSFYPDYKAIGYHVAELLQDAPLAEPGNRTIRPTSDIKLTVNLRTAQHIGLELNNEVKAKIEVIFK